MNVNKDKLNKFLTDNWMLILLYVNIGLAVLFVFLATPSFVFGAVIGIAIYYTYKDKILDWIDDIICK